jgi:RNA polymerase sigma-70 factor (ECF subfamily)
MTDDLLLRRLQAQDQDALAQLMQKYHRYVSTIILGMIHSPEDVEELVEDTFYSLWSTTARNKAKSYLRSRKELPMALDTVEIPDSGTSLEDAVQREEMAKLLRRTIHKMSPKDREIFLRHYYYLQTAEEISHILGIPRSTVLSRLRRGRAKLEKSLAKEDLF